MDDALHAREPGPPSVLTLLLGNDVPGGPREVPLRYVARDTSFYVLARARPLPWWAQALQVRSTIEWRVGEWLFSGEAAPLSEGTETTASLLQQLNMRHGRRKVQSWFGSDVVGFLLRSRSVRHLASDEPIASHFDDMAQEYDRRVAANPLDTALRAATVRMLLDTFSPGDRVLEIGCGTGLETLALARAGIDLVPIDVSQKMLDRLKDKAVAEGLQQRIRPRRLRASDIGVLSEEYGEGSFKGAFSNFGALNLEPRLEAVPGGLARLVERHGSVLLTIWNRACLVEMASNAIRLRPRRALARLQSPVPVGLSRFGLPAFAYAPGAFLRLFRPAFDVTKLEALPFLVPPYDFLPHIPRPDRVLPLLESADRPFRRRFPFNRLGDHFLALLRRT